MPKINLGIKTVSRIPGLGKGYINPWDKACRKGHSLMQNNLTPIILRNALKSDVVEITEKTQPQITKPEPHIALQEISSMGISKLRVLDTRTYSGETLENNQEKLKKLKSLGIDTIIDFREEGGEAYKKACLKEGLNFFHFPLKHSSKFNTKNEIPDAFVDKMKQFFEIYNTGNAYMSCKWGIDRTNIALIMNYLLNPIPHMSPEIIAWGGESVKSVINKDVKIVESLYKTLTSEQKEKLGISEAWRDVMKRRSKRLIEKNKI